MDEQIKVSKEVVASDEEARHLGLTDFEYAYYTASTPRWPTTTAPAS